MTTPATASSAPDAIRTLLPTGARAALAATEALGAGNVLWHARAASPAPAEPLIWLERAFINELDGARYEAFSLATLGAVVTDYAAWYHSVGVKAKEVVAVYLGDGVEHLVHFFALTALGAIPALINGAMPVEAAREHVRRIGAVLLLTDQERRPHFLDHGGPLCGLRAVVPAGALRQALAPGQTPILPPQFPFAHEAEDPVMIAHSSGTTGQPKPVLLQHHRFFYGIRYRLGQPRAPGEGPMLSALPHSHNCAIAYIMLALLCGTPVYILSDHAGAKLLATTAAWRPSAVVAFPETFVDATGADLSRYDVASVKVWMNGGDAAHEVHIRQLLKAAPGSRFIDGMGSSEMGFSLFRHVHTSDSDHYRRCVGRPHSWVNAKVLGPDGAELPPGEVGRLAVQAPSVTTGYWNDSVLTHQTRVGGYWLTGDLAYRDADGWFYHVDRTPDVVRTATGPLYSLAAEELLLAHCPDLLDCSVFAGRRASAGDAADVPLALVRLRQGGEAALAGGRAGLLRRLNQALERSGLPPLADVHIATPGHVPLGATGKVLKRQLRNQYAQLDQHEVPQ